MLWLLENLETVTFEALEPLLPRISESRRARVLSMKQEQARVQSVLAELLLRHALREEYGLAELPKIETGKKGKPFFPDHPDVHFNLSHCKTAVACALDSAPVGVDVQEIRPLRDRLSSPVPSVYRVLSEKERTWVEAGKTSAEQDRRFTAVWTCKEAYGKAVGEGFLYDLRSTEFLPRKKPWQQSGYLFRYCDLGDTALTLCAEHPLRLRRVELRRLISKLLEEQP
ncbi:MAG: 4'-phosphopantetheinyl transferase superfamily protein [Oscillospiraceae bacterium]|nr:4'-phosphopantetheinyl transferase superfamily protein [Oscillospiraceae bacterium]